MHETVKDYYGKQLQTSADLKTDACCDLNQTPGWLKPLLATIHPEVTSRYYGCGLVCPTELRGCRILDLGSGAGRDVYILAQLVGSGGEVVGVDMTTEQLAIAEQYRQHHAGIFGYDNVRFLRGYIEKLDQLGLEEGSFDVVVSNCVINLSPDKDAVLAGVRRLLKPGGEFYFSDVYADRRIPAELREDPVLYGECLGGALYWNDFLALARRQGFADPRLVEHRPLAITNPELEARLGAIRFASATYRLFKLDEIEADGEDYGQTVTYLGSIAEQPDAFQLDAEHRFATGQERPVSGNTWRMLHDTRFAAHFKFSGDFTRHRGLFDDAAKSNPFAAAAPGVPEPVKTGCC
jgi:SAM-dependent methyltransferase